MQAREVWKPNDEMCLAHSAVKSMLWLYDGLPSTTGGLPGGSTFLHAKRHADQRHVVQADIRSAFAQVDTDVLIDRALDFYHPGYDDVADRSDYLAFLIGRHCVMEGAGLYMGGPASNLLFDIYARPMDQDIARFCSEHDITYTRYIDDLAFSRPDSGRLEVDVIGRGTRRSLWSIAESHGLPVQPKKIRVDDLADGPVTIVGMQLNPSGNVQIPTRSLRQIPRIVEDSLGLPVDELAAIVAGYIGYLKSSRDESRIGRLQTNDYYRTLAFLEAIHKKATAGGV